MRATVGKGFTVSRSLFGAFSRSDEGSLPFIMKLVHELENEV